MAPPLTRRLGYSIDSAVIELFMSLSRQSMNEGNLLINIFMTISMLLKNSFYRVPAVAFLISIRKIDFLLILFLSR